MITKITSSEYLKRFDNMDGAEREVYMRRVGEWLQKQAPLLMPKMQDPSAVFLNAVQCSAGWNDAECQAWTEGARLLTAMTGTADTWLPDMLYTKAAKRAIKQMVKVLKPAWTPVEKPTGTEAGTVAEPTGTTQRMVAGAAKEAPFRPVDSGHQVGEGQTKVKPTPVRPKHIDQYVHLLPESTQKKAATVQGLLRDLDVAREKARLLMDDPKANADSRAQWAKTATALDAKVKAIYRELDAEWEKLVAAGRVTVDDFGNAHVIPAAEATGTMTKSNEVKAQIKSLRSWLRDTRGPKDPGEKKDAYVARWKEKYQEMVKLGGKDTVTEAVQNAAKLYGIVIDELIIEN